MRIYITGISGFLGINLVRYLLQQGYTEIAGIDLVDFTYPERPLIQFFQGDIRDPEAVRQSMAGAQIVIHTAAALPLYAPADIFSTDVEGTRLLLEHAQRLGVERFIHISSTAVYGVPDHHPIYEDDPLSGVGPYGQAKVQAEAVCLEFRQRGMCVPILRPKSFVGTIRGLYYSIRMGQRRPQFSSDRFRQEPLPVIGCGRFMSSHTGLHDSGQRNRQRHLQHWSRGIRHHA